MIKSPLRYPGGKSRGVAFLSQFIPAFAEVREVFFGGGSVSIHLAQQFPGKIFKAADLNYELYCFWQQLKTVPDSVVADVQQIYSEWNGRDGRQLFDTMVQRRHHKLSELQRAVDFFVLNRITFSGVVDAGGYSKGSFEGRFTQSAINRLKPVAGVIQAIEFSSEDYTALLSAPGNDVFIFLDPPYYNATKSRLYGKGGELHTGFDHQRLYEQLKTTPHRWLMTYDNSDFIRDLYKDYYQLPWSLQYGMTNTVSEQGNELLVSNYDITKLSGGKA